jgi:ATP-dependent Zn protease
VGELGMAMGPRVLYDKQGSRYLGNEGGSRKAISETVQVMADNEISRLLEGADQLALKVLQRHKPLLDAMVRPATNNAYPR